MALPPVPPSLPESLIKAGNVPQMATPKHPCRCSILGTTHIKPQLKQLIQIRDDIPDSIKAVIMAEIDAKKTDAAQVHLHVIDHPNGDSSIQIHVKEVKLG